MGIHVGSTPRARTAAHAIAHARRLRERRDRAGAAGRLATAAMARNAIMAAGTWRVAAHNPYGGTVPCGYRADEQQAKALAHELSAQDAVRGNYGITHSVQWIRGAK